MSRLFVQFRRMPSNLEYRVLNLIFLVLGCKLLV